MTDTNEPPQIWPRGMQSPDKVRDLFGRHLAGQQLVNPALQKPSALAAMAFYVMPGSKKWMPSLTESIQFQRGRCYNRTAYAVIAAQVLGMRAVPAVCRYNVGPPAQEARHAYPLCLADGELIETGFGSEPAHFVKDSTSRDWSFGVKLLLREYPDLMELNDVIQVRHSLEMKVEPTFHHGETTLDPADGSVHAIDTVFLGPTGLGAYLNFVENRSAVSQQRTPHLNPDFIVPGI